MLNKLHTKLKNPFIREVLLAVVLFCLPFLLGIHVLFSYETASVFYIFGWKYDHGFGSDQMFAWVIIAHIIPVLYLLFFIYFSKRGFKFLVLPIISWLVFYIIHDLVSSFRDFASLTIGWISFLLTIAVTSWFLKIYYTTISNFKKVIINSFAKNELVYSILLLTTLLFSFLHEIVPLNENKIINFSLFEIDAHGFETIELLLWAISLKTVILIPMILWFLTEKKWWKYALLSPILLTIYQLRNILFVDSEYFDEFEILQALPLLGLVLIVLLALSKNAKEQYLFQAIYQKTYARFEQKALAKHRKKEEALAQAKAKLKALKTDPNKKDLAELLELKRQLEQKLSE